MLHDEVEKLKAENSPLRKSGNVEIKKDEQVMQLKEEIKTLKKRIAQLSKAISELIVRNIALQKGKEPGSSGKTE